jgi:hypothetical protein
MNYSATLLRLTKAVLLVATLLGYCASLPVVSRPQRPAAMMDSAMDTSKAPKLKQLQEASHGSRAHEFPANSIDSLERDMREATTAEAMAETTPSMVQATSGDGSPRSSTESTESTTTTAQPDSDESSSTQTARTERSPLESPRDQIKKLMRHYYTDRHAGGLEELSSFFSLSEMYRLGPLATDNRVDNPPPPAIVEDSQLRCQRMVDRLNTNRQNADYCHWTYTCNYNANRFPSMIVNATQCTAVEDAECVQRISRMQTFSRTFVGVESTWRKDDIPASVVYAYTCRRK